MPTGSTPSGVVTPATVSYGDSGFLENPYGKEVPEAVRWVVSAGATLKDLNGFSSSLRLRYFGPRPLTSDAIYTSPSTTLVNFEASYKFNKNWSLVGEVLNVFNRRDHDVDYAYVSQITPASALELQGQSLPATPPTTLAGQELVANAIDANAAFTRVMHPVEPVQARFTLRYSFGPLKQTLARLSACAGCARANGCARADAYALAMLRIACGDGHHQAAVLHAFEADENVGEVLDAGRLAMDDEHFKAGIVVEMRVTRGDNQVVVLVLRFSELLGDAVGMVVEDEGDGADDGRVGRGSLLPHQPVADQVAKGFGTVRVSALLDGAVESLQQIRIEGNADSA